MKSKLALVIGLTVALLLTASCGRQQGSSVKPEGDAQARIEFLEGEEHDFGTYYVRDTVYHDFVFRNVGTVPFTISRIEPSCHCTSASFSERPVAPGSTDTIRVSYDGNGFVPGHFVKRCDIYSNADTVYHLRIHGRYYEKE